VVPAVGVGQRHGEVGRLWDHDHRGDDGDGDQPVEEQVADDVGDQGPGVAREEPPPRREEVAEVAELPDGPRLGRWHRRVRVRLVVNGVPPEDPLDLADWVVPGLAPPLLRDPGLEPRRDVAAAGDGGQVVELVEESPARERLEHAQVEGRAPDPAAREAEGGEGSLVRRRLAEQLVEPPQPEGRAGAVLAGRRQGRAPPRAQQRELLGEHLRERPHLGLGIARHVRPPSSRGLPETGEPPRRGL